MRSPSNKSNHFNALRYPIAEPEHFNLLLFISLNFIYSLPSILNIIHNPTPRAPCRPVLVLLLCYNVNELYQDISSIAAAVLRWLQ